MSMLKSGLLAATFLLVACGQDAPGGGSADAKGVQATDRKLDVAGVKIGMSVAEATAALRSGGWEIAQQKGDSWEAAVNNELSRENVQGSHLDFSHTGIGGLSATKGQETVLVEFNPAPPPLIGRVKVVSYSVPGGAQSSEQILAGLARRYGAPDVVATGGGGSGPYEGTWCVGGPSCAGGNGFGKRTWLRAGMTPGSGQVRIRMEGGRDTYNAFQAQLRSATGAALGPQAKPSY